MEPFKHDIIVRAGAGAGKTTRLTEHVFEVVKQFKQSQGRFPKIVVTTFTRKATQELRERLILKACEEDDSQLVQFVSDNSSLFISTIHGVLSQFLRKYAHLVDLDNSFSLVQPYMVSSTAKKIIRDLIVKNQDYYALLDRFGFEHLHQICRKYYEAKQVREDLRPANKRDFTEITRKILLEESSPLLKTVEFILAETDDEKWTTYCNGIKSIILNLTEGVPKENAISVIDQIRALGSKPRLSKKNLQVSEELDGDLKIHLNNFKELLQSDFLNQDYWETQLETYLLFQNLGEDFTNEFFEFKKKTGQFEMQDLELLTLTSIRKEPRLAEAFSAEYDYWLIDEYQDTSPLQAELLAPLVGEKACFIVGDPQQSIYLFRGANSELFKVKEKEIEKKGGAQNYLIKNYRSQPELLEFFNFFFSRLGDQFTPMEPRAKTIDPKKLVASIAVCSDDVENQLKAEDVELKAIGHRVGELLKEGHRFDDICILARTHRQLEEVSQFLQSFNLPTHIHSSSGFYKRREVIDLLFIVKFLINPHDNLNLVGLLRTPWFYLADSLLAKELHNQGSQTSLWQRFKTSNDHALQQLRILMEQKQSSGISETLVYFLSSTCYINSSLLYDPTGRRESNIWKLIHLLKEEEKNPGFTYIDFVNQTLETTASTEGNEEGDAVASIEPNRINLMTIHASKGLKFNHVIVPFLHKRPKLSGLSNFNFDLTKGSWSFPVPMGDELKLTNSPADWWFVNQLKKRELLENDRVLYVALTRAVETVFLSWQDKVAAQSWVDRLRIKFDQGVIQANQFSYKVSFGPWDVSSNEADNSYKVIPRGSWDVQQNNEVSHRRKHSVSSLLEKKWASSDSSAYKKPLQELLKVSQDGVLIHRLMEALKFDFEYDFSSLVEDWFSGRESEINSAIDFVKRLSSPPINEIIKNGHVEWGFQLATDKGILEGQIDLWGKDEHGTIWVIDYKSGSEKYSDRAFEQLQYYAEALTKISSIKEQTQDIQLAVIYPLKGKVQTRSFLINP